MACETTPKLIFTTFPQTLFLFLFFFLTFKLSELITNTDLFSDNINLKKTTNLHKSISIHKLGPSIY